MNNCGITKVKPEIIKLDPPESQRTYIYPDGYRFALFNITGIGVSKSGTHRVESEGKKFIILPKFIAVEIITPEWTF